MNIWKTIEIGGKSKKQYLASFKKESIFVSDYAKELIEKVEFQKKKEKINLVKMSVKDLGFTGYPTTTEIYTKAREKGLELLPAEAGLALRLAYKDQPISDYFWVGTEPISGSGGRPGVFYVLRVAGGERWLDSFCAFPAYRWGLSFEVVFRFSNVASLKSSALEPSETLPSTLVINGVKYLKQ